MCGSTPYRGGRRESDCCWADVLDRRPALKGTIPIEKITEAVQKVAQQRQVGGDHYAKHGPHQPWEVLKSWLTPEEYRGWLKGNALVYLARERDKGGVTDIEKARHTLEQLVEVLMEEAK
jgi:hypothetical protein